MTISVEEIRKLRRELERDIEALNRVEALLARTATQPLAERGGPGLTHASNDDAATENKKLTPQTIDVIRQAGPSGIRASEVVKELIKRGYEFTTKKAGASSVATTLKRLVRQKKIEKKDRLYSLKVSE
jgi:hypothetical protein